MTRYRVFFNWSSPKNRKYGKKLKYQKVGNILLTEKHLELLGATSWHLEILGGDQFEISKTFIYRKKLVIFRGGPVKKITLYLRPQKLQQ